MARFDFDAALAEIDQDLEHEIIIGGKTYMARTPSLGAIGHMEKDDWIGLIREAFPGDLAEEILAKLPASKQGGEIMGRFLEQVIGIRMGEFAASSGTSRNGGGQSRPTSKPTTESTPVPARPVDSGS